MAKAKDRPAPPTKTVKSAGEKSPGSRPTRAPKPAKTAPDAPSSGETGAQPTPEQLYRMIQETAYFKAKARNFEPGHEVQDWIEAEAEVRRSLENRA